MYTRGYVAPRLLLSEAGAAAKGRYCGGCNRRHYKQEGAQGACATFACPPFACPQVPPSMGHLKTLKEFNLRYNNLDDRYKAKVEEGLSK